MDMLVLIMLALFLVIIALAVIIYVTVRRNSVDKKFGKTIDSDVNDLDDDDDDEFANINIVMPSSFKENKLENVETEKKEQEKIAINNENVNELEKDEETKENETLIVASKKEEKNEEKEKIEEVVNVLINKKNYIFLANNNIVSKNDYIKLMLDGKVYFGVVTKPNYQRDILQLKVKPRKLMIIKNMNKKENEKRELENSKQDEIVEFVPKKKEKM